MTPAATPAVTPAVTTSTATGRAGRPGMGRAFVGLGSNLGDRYERLSSAALALPGARAASHVYETAPLGGPRGQPAYLNAVVELATDLGPYELLEACMACEEAAGRARYVRDGPRVLDADLLMVASMRLHSSQPVALELPHPRMWQRRFVLEPLAELATGIVSEETLAACSGEVRRMPEMLCC
ncbi:MAG: 2-amino-4-hydroxy-6-hydroxymethyldihydropteridine diphosphokinase [Acidimicrobiales bacterium]